MVFVSENPDAQALIQERELRSLAEAEVERVQELMQSKLKEQQAFYQLQLAKLKGDVELEDDEPCRRCEFLEKEIDDLKLQV